MKKLGKNQREVKLFMDSHSVLEGPVNELQARVENFITGTHMECNDPELVQMGWDGDEWEVHGWRHATQKEIEKSRAASVRAKEQAAKRRAQVEAEERKEYEKLKAKFGGV